MFNRNVYLGLVAVLGFPSVIFSIRYTVLDGGTQFIFYNGSISGSFVPDQNSRSICKQSSYSFGPYANSSMRVGVNSPSWDTNPIYFDLDHDGNDHRNSGRLGRSSQSPHLQNRQVCYGPWGCTSDAFYNLGFSSTRFSCYKDGQRCGSFESSPWTYVGEPNIDLTSTTINRISDRSIDPSDSDDGGPFYSFTGDQRTWVKENNTQQNMFDFSVPYNYTEDSRCELRFKWNESIPFTYTVSFTNNTATALFTVNASLGNFEISFKGKRADGDDNELAPTNVYGQHSAISLADPSQHELPMFTFTNGTEFKWVENSRGEWNALSASVRTAAPWLHLAMAGGLGLLIIN